MVVVEEDKFVDVQEGFTRLIAGCRSMVANRNVVGAMEPQGIGLRENRLMQAPITPRDQHIAQEGGAYPVYIEKGGMRDTIQFGVKCRDTQNFRNALIAYLHESIAGKLENDRQHMRDWATSTFDWDRAAREYTDLFWRGK